MSAEDRILLSLVALLSVGVALICYGSNVTSSKMGATVCGVAVCWVAMSLLAMIWRGRG